MLRSETGYETQWQETGEVTAMADSKSERASTVFLSSFRRLLANWPIDEGRYKTLEREYRAIFDEVGVSRFDAGVSSILREGKYQFFPSLAEFRAFIPAPGGRHADANCEKCHGSGWMRLPDYEARRMYRDPNATCVLRCQCLTSDIDTEAIRAMARDRRQNPDEYFGDADVVAMMRIALERKGKGQQALNADAMIAEVLAVRTAIRERV